MPKLKVYLDPRSIDNFNNFLHSVKLKLNYLCQLIIDIMTDDNLIYEQKKTLKWGEPSYKVKRENTHRLNWNSKTPRQYTMHFKCSSILFSSFKKLYTSLFNYKNDRVTVFKLGDVIPEKELKERIRVT